MTRPATTIIDVSPGRIKSMHKDRDFQAFIKAIVPHGNATHLRKAAELVWLAHQIYPTMFPQHCPHGGLGESHYQLLIDSIEEQMTLEAGHEITIGISGDDLKAARKRLKAAGYLRYVPLEQRWYFAKRAASTFRKLADLIDDFQEPATNKARCHKLLHDFKFYHGEVKKK